MNHIYHYTFFGSHIKKKSEISFNETVYLTQYIQNIAILARSQYKKLEVFFFLFFSHFLWKHSTSLFGQSLMSSVQ